MGDLKIGVSVFWHNPEEREEEMWVNAGEYSRECRFQYRKEKRCCVEWEEAGVKKTHCVKCFTPDKNLTKATKVSDILTAYKKGEDWLLAEISNPSSPTAAVAAMALSMIPFFGVKLIRRYRNSTRKPLEGMM